jgi:hypothetical protein
MTTDEFIAALKEKDVPLPSGVITAQRTLRSAIADVLAELLPSAAVEDGVELARLQYGNNTWTGHIEWLLLLDTHLLHLTGQLANVEQGKVKLSVTHQFYRLSTLIDLKVTTEQERAVAIHLYSAQLDLTFAPKGSLTVAATLPEKNANAVLSFSKRVLAAVGK